MNNKSNPIYDIVIVSGGFDPIHKGHIEYIKEASKLGKYVVCIANHDNFLLRKKGYVLIDRQSRLDILESIKYIDKVVEQSNPSNDDVTMDIELIHKLNPNKTIAFAKGGDRFIIEIPETKLCRKLGIDVVDGLGSKIASSSEIGNKLINKFKVD